MKLRKEIEGEWLLGLAGLLSILIGLTIPFLLTLYPAATILSVAWMIGIYALAFGILLIAQAVRLRRLGQSRNPVREASGGDGAAEARAA